MSNTETTSRTGEDVSPAARVSAAMAGLIGDYKALQADLEEKLQKQEERLKMLDHKSATANRPALSTRTEVDAPHQKAFDAYLRSGDDDGLRGLDLEGKAMSTAINSDGGFLVDPETSETIKCALNTTASIRQIANVVNVDATAFDVLIDQNDTGAGWANETGSTAETGTPSIERISVPLYELNAMPKVSQRLLDDSAFDVEAWLANRIAEKFARADAFCIGSEMRGLTQIRGADGFPAVDQLRDLAAECRVLLGGSVRIGYAADWSEYFGYRPQDGSNDVYFHLDPLWADDEMDFVGIDNYMPLSDWRDGDGHADASWGAVYDLDYLRSNIEGGEGFDWYYASKADRDAQVRTPITDRAHGEPWIWRYKDIRNWWSNAHHDRIGGVRQAQRTPWQPESKPIWFTELGCAAVDKATNQPNKFLDPKSSESALPYYSSGLRDEAIQQQYLKAQLGYWGEEDKNPVSGVYGGPMLDLSRSFVWAWDSRPYPWFPGSDALWADGPNYRSGHWLNGRASGRSLASVVTEICRAAGLNDFDTTGLHGFVRGYVIPQVSDARRALQPLMLAYGFDAVERDGILVFLMRRGRGAVEIARDSLVASQELDGDLEETRAGEAEMAGRVRVQFALADADHQIAAEETVLPDEATHAISETDLPLAMTRAEGRQTAERWLAEARIARDTVRFALPPSRLTLGAGDIVRLLAESGATLARIDKVEVMDHQIVDAVRIEPAVFDPSQLAEEPSRPRPTTPAVPVTPVFMDLPLMSGDEVPHAPHLALTAVSWPGAVALYDSAQDTDYGLNDVFAGQSVIGLTESALSAARNGMVDRGAPLQVRLASGSLQSVSDAGLLAGANLMAIGDGTPDNWELFQFRDAELVSKRRWALSYRLRGQAGSGGLMPPEWPAGSWVVLLDGTPAQISLKSVQRGLERHYRIGPASRSCDHASYEHRVLSFAGNGLRPYRPGHLRAVEQDGDLSVSWVRRTRIDGDAWELADVPLGEDRESYSVQVRQGETVVRRATVTMPRWTYVAADRAADGLIGTCTIAVAQLSERYGPGPFVTAEVAA